VLTQFLQDYQPYLAFMALAAVGLGIITIFLLLMVVHKWRKRSAQRMALARPAAARQGFGERFKAFRRTGRSLFGKLQDFTGRWQEETEDENAGSFKEAKHILREYLGGESPEYRLPWYLMIGPIRSGKTTILQDVDLELPLGKPEQLLTNQGDLDWWFYDRAVVIDARGALFLSETETDSDDEEWNKLMQHFVHHRAKRPLDGLILTIPATDLYGAGRPDQDKIMDRARYIYGKLWKLQSKLGMRLPVYIMVTKCDIIPGFKGFVAETPSQTHNDIFGWSCPYSLETSFSSAWLNDIFNYMHRALTKARTAIFAEGRVGSERDGAFLFASEFYHLKEGLGFYLNTIFKDSAYHESFFLRGVYFTGKAEVNNLVPSELGTPLAEAGSAASKHSTTLQREKCVFLRDLFEKKIFRESGLAQPLLRLMVSNNRKLNYFKAATAVFLLSWVSGIVYQSARLSENNQTLLHALTVINDALKGVHAQNDKMVVLKDNPVLLSYLEKQAETVLEQFSFIDNVDTFALALPSSWFSSLDRRIERAFTAAYNQIVLPAISAGLIRKGNELVSLQHIEYGPRQNSLSRLTLNPAMSPSFIVLQTYVDSVMQYEKAVEKYNNIEKTSNISDLGYLIKYLFNKDLPSQFYANTQYYQSALGGSVESAIDLNQYKVAAGQKLGLLFKSFLDSAFNIRENYAMFNLLQKSLEEFSDYNSARQQDDDGLRNLVQEAIAVADVLSSGQFSWVDKRVFEPSPAYTQVIHHIITSSLLGKALAQELSQVAEQDFIKFKLELAEFKSPLTGPFMAVRENQIFSDPSEGLVNLIDAITAFLAEPFMAKSDVYPLVRKVPAGKLLFWDETALQKGGHLIDAYSDYITQKINQAPHSLQALFKAIAGNSLRKKVTSLVAQAQDFQPQPAGYASLMSRDVLQAQVHNVAGATPHFTKILGTFEESSFVLDAVALRQLLVEQTYELLRRVDKLLDTENLYTAREEEFENWDGESMVGLKAFAVHDLADMKNYLNAQRYRMQFLSKELAEPILTLLSLGFLEGAASDLPLAFKWSRIAAVVQDYDTQSPSNTLKILEKFLAYDLNEITLENCNLENDEFAEYEVAGDYFLEIRNRYSREIMNRCQNVTGRKAIARFNRAATFFNTNLAGRFPFTQESDKASKFEADPVDVETFYQIFDGLNQTEILALMNASRGMGAQDSVRQFIRQVESVRPLMLAALDRGMANQIPAIKLQVAFRTDRHLETGGDKIIDWVMDFGDRKIDFRGNDAIAQWQVGAPVSVDLRWAIDSDSIPVGDPRNPALSVIGPKATFSYQGRWSLIRLIREHAVPLSRDDFSDKPQPQVLEFQIPTAYSPACYTGKPPLEMDRKSQPARVFCRIDLQVPVKGDKAAEEGVAARQMLTLAVPRFPTQAPLIEPVKFKRLRAVKGK
jgi:type VI secretion system protein ImpL